MLSLFLALAIAVGFSGKAPESPYVIGPNVQVSASQPTLRHYESYVGADPEQAGHLIACAYVTRPGNKADNVFYVSSNGGRTWAHSLTVSSAVDPSCEIGRGGVAFAASIHDQLFPDGKTDSVLSVYRSSDGGRTWHPSVVGVDTRGIDRAYLAVSNGRGTSSWHVYVDAYCASHAPPYAAVLFYRSIDDGRNFKTVLVKNATSFSKPWLFPANGVVAPNGDYFALVAELDNTKKNMSYRTDPASAPASADAVLCIFRSRDSGKTLELAAAIPDVYYDWRVAQLSMSSLAVDRSSGPFHGRLYAVWPDARYGHRTQILLSFSSDNGSTWSSPQVIGNDSTAHDKNERPNNFMPVVAVNRDGNVGVSWYDRRDNPDNIGYWVRFTASLDGGVSWLPSVRVSSSPNLATDDTRKNGGDTAGLAADSSGVFHPVWIDNRTGIPQMWTATVKLLGQIR